MDDVRKAVKSDGGLYLNSSGWISWDVGDDKITLDADFTIEQLEFIVAHMKAAQKKQSQLYCVCRKNLTTGEIFRSRAYSFSEAKIHADELNAHSANDLIFWVEELSE